MNWHWDNPLDVSKDPWSTITATQWSNIVTPGTSEYAKLIADIDLFVNASIKKLVSNGKPIPILFRPLHEIDGGWFWWTNQSDPSKTVALFKIVQDRVKNYHGMHNIIWVWNSSDMASSASKVTPFYPGNSYADIVAVDQYHTDYQNTGKSTNTGIFYKDYYNILGQVAPGKMRTLGECDALPNPDKTQSGDPNFPMWLYALAWWSPVDGGGQYCVTTPCNPAAWTNSSYNHALYLTKDELVFSKCAVVPVIPNVVLCATSAAPIIDGVAENIWSSILSNTINKAIVGTLPSATDFSVSYKAFLDNTALYLLVNVKDDQLINNNGATPWDDDAIEIYVDANNDKGTVYDANDHQYIVRYNDPTVYEFSSGTAQPINPTGISFAQGTLNGGYLMEFKFTWASIGATPPASGKLIGLEIKVNDDDDGGASDNVIAWNTTGNMSYSDPSSFGTAKLDNVACSITTQLDKENDTELFELFPNPSSQEITLTFAKQTEESEFSIVDIFGTIVKKMAIRHSTSTFQYAIADLQAGIYFVQIKTAGGSIVKKKMIVE